MDKPNPRFLLLIAFVSGFCVMAMEISASRLLAPYFGTSLFVWTNIIGIVLVALSLGYYFGGKLADKRPDTRLLLRLMLLAGVVFLIIPLVIKPLASAVDVRVMQIQAASVAIFVSSLLVTAALFAFPLFLLGMVSPYIIKLISISDEAKIGELSGRVFAVSTVGSILGTFLPTLYFIPFFGTKQTITVFAIVLMLLGSLGFVKSKNKLWLLVWLLPLGTFFLSQSAIKNYQHLIAETESAYQYISIVETPDQTRYLLYNEGGGIQSTYNPTAYLTGFYYDFYNLLPYLVETDQPKRVLIIGSAGGTIARQLDHFLGSDVVIDGVEIDQKVIDLAREHFDLDQINATFYNQDGRMFLRTSQNRYDLIIVDAYQQEIYIPFTLTTSEFWHLIQNHLTDTGVLALNINSIARDSPLLTSVVNTVASTFPNTYLTKINDQSWNYLVTASALPIDFTRANAVADPALKERAGVLNDQTEAVSYDSKVMVLTDNRAPVEFMTEAMALRFVTGSGR